MLTKGLESFYFLRKPEEELTNLPEFGSITENSSAELLRRLCYSFQTIETSNRSTVPLDR